jgi:hypothetical protein
MCRRHYGTNCCRVFVRGVHRESDSFICRYTGVKSANNQMNWLISKGQELPTSVDVHGTISLSEKFWDGQRRVTHLELFASDDDKAPKRLTDPVSAFVDNVMANNTDFTSMSTISPT